MSVCWRIKFWIYIKCNHGFVFCTIFTLQAVPHGWHTHQTKEEENTGGPKTLTGEESCWFCCFQVWGTTRICSWTWLITVYMLPLRVWLSVSNTGAESGLVGGYQDDLNSWYNWSTKVFLLFHWRVKTKLIKIWCHRVWVKHWQCVNMNPSSCIITMHSNISDKNSSAWIVLSVKT